MQKFSAFISEAVSASNLDKVSNLIRSYIARKAKLAIFSSGGEQYTNGAGSGVGVRYMIPATGGSFRVNWNSFGSVGMVGVSSVDFWLSGKGGGPEFRLKFNTGASLVTTLPTIAEILLTKKMPSGGAKVYVVPPDMLEEGYSTLNESKSDQAIDAFNALISEFKNSDFDRPTYLRVWKSAGFKIFEYVVRNYKILEKQGRSYKFVGNQRDIDALVADRDRVLTGVGVAIGSVSSVGGKERYKSDPKIDEIADNIERLSYDQQLEDLENLIRLTISGASNALFVSGRGGVGKTHTVEKVLASAGLRDGNGYFKNTGTASAAGIYSLLFKHQHDLILFDDSDDALKDQEARNMFKAATDTKKVRKLVWNKMGKNIVEPDEYEDPAELIDAGLLPRYFDFRGKIIFISNLTMDKLDPDKAIRTRAFLIDISPTDDEVYKFMEKIVGDFPLEDGFSLSINDRKKVVGLLRGSKSKQSANLRKLVRGLNMMAGAMKAGVTVSDDQLKRMIENYA
jgi:hypothetical protein